ncbi:Ppx/GppA phosphatase family protein [Chitinophaga rhizophila]|uniref:Exopolyphosphatase n=1 Tax=Chitinophaga rhizophila TaxID=2866212 RepID=A0ABS7G5H4_9BACT|nr:exopolyphosphatase [Chitinophaga rhizophila]MBW8682882.1 exopolyphosphatase [Chitinophaga rhizophila]
MRAAVIDLGTNTFHLIIADLSDGTVRMLYKTTVPVLLGQGRINENMIIPEAFERGIKTLSAFKATIDQHQADVIKATATSAVRSAINGQAFVDEARDVGIEIEVITGDQEAAYIFDAVRATGVIKDTVLVMDIGGGSTEFIIGDAKGLLWKKSYNIGAARLMQAYFHSDPMSDADRSAIITVLDETLGELKSACTHYKPKALVGSAGAFESYAAMLNNGEEAKDIPTMPLDIASYRALSAHLIASTHAQRVDMKGLISLRVDMIVIAAILTSYVLDTTGVQALHLSTYDLKMGILHSLLK